MDREEPEVVAERIPEPPGPVRISEQCREVGKADKDLPVRAPVE